MSQASRILKLLEDGPKTTREILAEVPSVVHSRIAQLREQGYEILCERTDGYGAGAFRYTLLSGPDEAASSPAGLSSGSESIARPLLSEPAETTEGPSTAPAGSENSVAECLICGQRMLGFGLRCDDCKQRALDGSEANRLTRENVGGRGNSEPVGASASLPSNAGEQLRLVA